MHAYVVVAAFMIIAGIAQACYGVRTLLGKFDPLLPKERKKLPAKAKKQARLLNAISLISIGIIWCVFGVGLFLGISTFTTISAIAMGILFVVALTIGVKIESKLFK